MTVTTGYAQVLYQGPRINDEIFIIEGVRAGRRFVTSTLKRGLIANTINRDGVAEPQVSHWRRKGFDPTGYQHPMDGWELQERYSA